MSHLGRSTSRGHTFSATPSRDSSRPSSAQSTHSNQSTYSGLSGLSNHQLPQQVDALIQAAASSNTDKKVEAIEALVDALKKQQITLEPTTLDPLLPPLLRLLHLPAPKLHLPSLHLLSRLSRLLSRTPRLPHSTLRTLLNDSLPLCLERLSDPRDKVREAAVDAAVELFGVVAGVAKEAERSAAVGGVGHQRAQEILGWVEKTVKADGLGSKSWRVREQTLLLLHHSLRMLPTFPTFGMRPYIPAVVRLLEDQQDPVRARAREVLVEAYNWDTTPATLRGEIHRELRKQPPRQSTSELLSAAFDETLEVAVPISNVSSPPQPQQAQPSALPLPRTRQGSGSVVSSVGSALSSPVDPDGGAGLMRGKTPSSGSLGGSKAVSGVPVRIAGSTRSSGGRETAETELAAGGGASPVGLDIKIEEDVKFHSPRDLDTFLMSFQSTFRGKETEQNWDERERMLKRVTTMCVRGYVGWDGFTGNGGREGGKGDTGAKIVCEGMGRTMLSLRTSLCLQTLSTITALSSTLPTCLDAYLESYLIPNLLKLGSGSKRITATAARQCLAHVLPRASLNPRHVQLLGDKYAEEKSAQGRAAIIGAVGCVVKGCVGISTRKEHFERGGGLGVVEMVLKKGVGDGNKEVREAAREVWSVVEKAWPGVADNWLNAMDATTRKAVMRGFGSALPVPATSGIRPPIRSKPSFTRPASASSTMSTEELPASSPSPKSERLSPLYPTTPAVVRTTVSDADVRRVPSPTSMVSERTSLSSGSRASSAPRSTPADRLAVLRSASSTPLLRRSAASALLLDLDSGAVELGMLLAALSEAYEVDPTLADDVLERLVTRTGDDAVLDELCHLLKPLEDVVRTPPRRMPESTSSRLVRMPANTTAVLYWLDARLEVASWWLAVRAHLHSLVLLVGPLVGEVEDALAAAMCARLLRRCAAEDTEEFWKVLESLEPDVAERAEVIVGGRDGSGVMSEADDDEHVDEDTMEAIEIMPTDFPVGRNDRNSIGGQVVRTPLPVPLPMPKSLRPADDSDNDNGPPTPTLPTRPYDKAQFEGNTELDLGLQQDWADTELEVDERDDGDSDAGEVITLERRDGEEDISIGNLADVSLPDGFEDVSSSQLVLPPMTPVRRVEKEETENKPRVVSDFSTPPDKSRQPLGGLATMNVNSAAQGRMRRLFANETPETTRSQITSELLPSIITRIQSGQSLTDTLVRNLLRLSAQAADGSADSDVWKGWMGELIRALALVFRRHQNPVAGDLKERVAQKERCCIVVQSLQGNQSKWMSGYESEVVPWLLEARCDESPEVVRSAIWALHSTVTHPSFRTSPLLSAVFRHLDTYGVEHVGVSPPDPSEDCGEHPAAAGIQVLATILERSATLPSDSDDVPEQAALDKSVTIMQTALVHPYSWVRRAGVFLAVSLHRHTVVGQEPGGVFDHLPASNPELYKRRKLVQVYIDKALESETAEIS